MTYSGPMDAVLAERDKLRAEVERLAWNLAGISTIACAESLDHYVPGQDWERAALGDTVKLVRKLQESRAEVERLRATDKEAKSAFAPWVQGPGIVGGILHLQEEVERLRADANARAVEELRKLHHRSWYGVVDLDREIDKRIVELSKPAARESEPVKLDGLVIGGVKVTKDNLKCFFDAPDVPVPNGCVVDPYSSRCCDRGTKSCIEEHNGEESTATAAPSRSPQGEGVEVPPRGQEQGASRPRGIGQPAHPPGARGGESGIVAESQGHRSGETVSYRSFNVFGVTFTADPRAPRSAVQRAMEFITHAFSAVTTRADMKPEEPDWTVTLAAQAKVAYVNSAEPADELKVRLLSLVVEGLCNLGREVRRGGKS